MSISEKIVNYLLDLKYEEIPADVIEYSKFALADYYAVTYPGSKTRDAEIIRKYADLVNLGETCSIIGYEKKYSAQHAALINGMMSHALDYDDVGLTAINHPSVTNAPVALALGEELGRSGEEVLFAYTLAVEIQHKIAGALMPQLTNKGWHTTSVFGTIGATVAAMLMYKLNKKEMINALGIAVSLAGGVRANFGTFTKPFHSGMAAQNGVFAAQLAASGMTASEFAFEGDDGYALAFANLKISEDDIKLGEPWDAQFAGYQFKKYPVCSSSHTAVDAFLELQREYRFEYMDIKHVNTGMSEFAFRNLLFNNPQTPQQAKFSMPYAIACCAVHRNLTLEHFTKEAIMDMNVREVMEKVEMTLDNLYKDSGILSNEPAVVYVTLNDGTRLIKKVEYALGTIRNPLSKEQLKSKFDNCLLGYRKDKVDEMFEAIFDIENYSDINEFLEKLVS